MRTVQDHFDNLASVAGVDELPSELIHPILTYRSIFLSDIHLGAPGCLAADLVQFLDHTKSEYLYLVGDIFDCWTMGVHRFKRIEKLFKGSHYSRDQRVFLQKIIAARRRGVKIVITPGNHDEVLRDLIGNHRGNFLTFFTGIELFFDCVHKTADGRHFLVMHGDSFDEVIRSYRWLSILGARVYNFFAQLSLWIDKYRKKAHINFILENLGLTSHWSLAHAIKTSTDGQTYSPLYRQTMIDHLVGENAKIYARRKNQLQTEREPFLDGIIGGHTHVVDRHNFTSPVDVRDNAPIGPEAVTYYNTGHWTGPPIEENRPYENRDWRNELKNPTGTAVVEYMDGRIGHVRWVPGQGVVAFNPGVEINMPNNSRRQSIPRPNPPAALPNNPIAARSITG